MKGRIKIWGVDAAKEGGCDYIDSMPEGTHTGQILALGYSDDSSKFQSISADLTMKYWDIERARMISTRYFATHNLFAICAVFSSTKNLALIGADDQSLRIITAGEIGPGVELYKFFAYGNICSITSIPQDEDAMSSPATMETIVCGGMFCVQHSCKQYRLLLT